MLGIVREIALKTFAEKSPVDARMKACCGINGIRIPLESSKWTRRFS